MNIRQIGRVPYTRIRSLLINRNSPCSDSMKCHARELFIESGEPATEVRAPLPRCTPSPRTPKVWNVRARLRAVPSSTPMAPEPKCCAVACILAA